MTRERKWNDLSRLQDRYARLVAEQLDRRERSFERYLRMIGREVRRQQAVNQESLREG